MLCIGHRGAMGHEPENTLLSVRKAIALGVDAVEIDVYNVENNLVVIHDRDLARTTNGSGYLDRSSFAYVRSLDAGKGQKIPTLREVFDAVNRHALINIELKGSNTAEPVVNLIQTYLSAGWAYSDFIVSSFNHYELNRVKQICPEVTTGMLIYGLPWDYLTSAQELQVSVVIPSLDYVSVDLVRSVQQLGLQTWVYTVNQPDDIQLMRKLEVDGIFTNYPERVLINSTSR
ncbi:MAG: glycerophosphodiester phosphodiesterase family protein [Cyanobacteria bacterium J06600_6]